MPPLFLTFRLIKKAPTKQVRVTSTGFKIGVERNCNEKCRDARDETRELTMENLSNETCKEKSAEIVDDPKCKGDRMKSEDMKRPEDLIHGLQMLRLSQEKPLPQRGPNPEPEVSRETGQEKSVLKQGVLDESVKGESINEERFDQELRDVKNEDHEHRCLQAAKPLIRKEHSQKQEEGTVEQQSDAHQSKDETVNESGLQQKTALVKKEVSELHGLTERQKKILQDFHVSFVLQDDCPEANEETRFTKKPEFDELKKRFEEEEKHVASCILPQGSEDSKPFECENKIEQIDVVDMFEGAEAGKRGDQTAKMEVLGSKSEIEATDKENDTKIPNMKVIKEEKVERGHETSSNTRFATIMCMDQKVTIECPESDGPPSEDMGSSVLQDTFTDVLNSLNTLADAAFCESDASSEVKIPVIPHEIAKYEKMYTEEKDIGSVSVEHVDVKIKGETRSENETVTIMCMDQSKISKGKGDAVVEETFREMLNSFSSLADAVTGGSDSMAGVDCKAPVSQSLRDVMQALDHDPSFIELDDREGKSSCQCCCRNAGKQIEEDEDDTDVFITNSAYSVLNMVCPVSGKPVVELVDPVRSEECEHIYDRASALSYLASTQKDGFCLCAAAGCRALLTENKLVTDSRLWQEIEELREINKAVWESRMLQDFANADESDDDD